jgi:molecular chaperone GrpE (heat shock protein)
MNQSPAPRIAKWPFLVGDVLLLVAAAWVALNGSTFGVWQYAAVIGGAALGAWLMVWPFVLEFRAATKLSESAALTSITDKVRDLDKVATSVASAVTEWQHMQQSATQTVTAAEHIAERMTAEARNFGEVLSKMHEAEKSHLRLEVDKLRRAEGDWLSVATRMLDHVHALHQAGVRSKQRHLVEQLGAFQHACRDVARRIGLVPIVPEPGTPFDVAAHQVMDGAPAPEGAVIAEVIAPGYAFQGQGVRRAVVLLGNRTEAAEAPSGKAGAAETDTQLSLGVGQP